MRLSWPISLLIRLGLTEVTTKVTDLNNNYRILGSMFEKLKRQRNSCNVFLKQLSAIEIKLLYVTTSMNLAQFRFSNTDVRA